MPVTVTLNEVAVANLLESTVGPVGIDLARRADQVKEKANANASGQIIGVLSGDLRGGIRARVEHIGGPGGLRAVIGTDARHRGFNYPLMHELGYDPNNPSHKVERRPWLSDALKAFKP